MDVRENSVAPSSPSRDSKCGYNSSWFPGDIIWAGTRPAEVLDPNSVHPSASKDRVGNCLCVRYLGKRPQTAWIKEKNVKPWKLLGFPKEIQKLYLQQLSKLVDKARAGDPASIEIAEKRFDRVQEYLSPFYCRACDTRFLKNDVRCTCCVCRSSYCRMCVEKFLGRKVPLQRPVDAKENISIAQIETGWFCGDCYYVISRRLYALIGSFKDVVAEHKSVTTNPELFADLSSMVENVKTRLHQLYYQPLESLTNDIAKVFTILSDKFPSESSAFREIYITLLTSIEDEESKLLSDIEKCCREHSTCSTPEEGLESPLLKKRRAEDQSKGATAVPLCDPVIRKALQSRTKTLEERETQLQIREKALDEKERFLTQEKTQLEQDRQRVKQQEVDLESRIKAIDKMKRETAQKLENVRNIAEGEVFQNHCKLIFQRFNIERIAFKPSKTTSTG